MSDEMYTKLAQAVIDGEADDAVALSNQALEEGLDPLTCINEGLTKGIQRVGELFSTGEYYLPELIIGADVMKAALDILEPAMLADQKREVVKLMGVRADAEQFVMSWTKGKDQPVFDKDRFGNFV